MNKNEVICHYDKLIEENNDPVTDPPPLREYMDKWDGQVFLSQMQLAPEKTVLEIGVGTGRIAMKVAPLCQSFTGIDLSPKTIERAKEHLEPYLNIMLLCGDFNEVDFENQSFDVIYSSLTFMHFENKQGVVGKVFRLLNPGGRFVLSIDKNQEPYIDLGSRKIAIYPDKPEDMGAFLIAAGFLITEIIETEVAYIFAAKKGEQ